MKDSGLKKALIRYAFPYGSTRKIFAGACRGMHIKIVNGAHAMLWNYEKDHQRFLSGKVKKGMTVYDVGANLGQYTLFFSKLVGPSGRVVSFEPNEEVYRTLLQNIELNRLANVAAYNVALGDFERSAFFDTDPKRPTMGQLSSLADAGAAAPSSRTEVAVRRLDGFVEKEGWPDLIKIDTEGAARMIFEGGLEAIRTRRPMLFVELHNNDEWQGVQTLIKMGYRFSRLDGRSEPISEECTPLWGESE